MDTIEAKFAQILSMNTDSLQDLNHQRPSFEDPFNLQLQTHSLCMITEILSWQMLHTLLRVLERRGILKGLQTLILTSLPGAQTKWIGLRTDPSPQPTDLIFEKKSSMFRNWSSDQRHHLMVSLQQHIAQCMVQTLQTRNSSMPWTMSRLCLAR